MDAMEDAMILCFVKASSITANTFTGINFTINYSSTKLCGDSYSVKGRMVNY